MENIFRVSSCHVFPCQFWCLIERRRMTAGKKAWLRLLTFTSTLPRERITHIYIYIICMHACMYIYLYIFPPFKGTFESMIFRISLFMGYAFCFRKRVTSLSNNTNTCTPKWNCSSRFLKLSSGRGFGETRFPSTKRFLFWKKRPTSNTFFKHSGHSFD